MGGRSSNEMTTWGVRISFRYTLNETGNIFLSVCLPLSLSLTKPWQAESKQRMRPSFSPNNQTSNVELQEHAISFDMFVHVSDKFGLKLAGSLALSTATSLQR